MSIVEQHLTWPGYVYHGFSSRDRAQLEDLQLYADAGIPAPDEAHLTSCMSHYDSAFSQEQRELLFDRIMAQAPADIASMDEVSKQLDALKKGTTYCIVTAHQPCLMTGPLYVVYKIASAIALANQLNKTYPENHFVPVYVLGSEDHDLAEINHFHLFGHKVIWNAEGQGAVGRMPLTESIADILEVLDEKLQREPHHAWLLELLRSAYAPEYTVAQAIQRLVYSLFGHHGLLVLDPDDAELKASAQAIFQRELDEQISYSAANSLQSQLEQLGHKSQVFARPINLFYLGDSRVYITQEGDHFLADGALLDSAQLIQEAHRLSPNVILRPVYQQFILPSIAYIGGGAEVAYWAELHDVMTRYGVCYPCVLRRDSAMLLMTRHMKTWQDADLTHDDFMAPFRDVELKFLEAHTDISWHFDEELEELRAVYLKIKNRSLAVDKGLQQQIDKMQHAAEKQVAQLEGRLRKQLKAQQSTALHRIRRVYDTLHPADKPQERYDSPLSFLARYGAPFIDELVERFDPSSRKLHLFVLS